MKRRFLFYILLLFSLSTMISSCTKDDPSIPNEEELITSFKMILTPISGGNTVTFSFQDLDGVGGKSPEIASGTLKINSTYNAKLELTNESVIPLVNITKEIDEEAEDHQFFYQSTVNGLSISYADKDRNGNPIGLSTLVKTVGSALGKLTITLRHKPNKTGQGVATGDINKAGGETDLAITFDIIVE